jgi:hypothetical protein
MLPTSAKEQRLLAQALHKSTHLHPKKLILGRMFLEDACSSNVGEFLASSGLVHLLQDVELLVYSSQPLGKGLATVST